MDDYGEYGEEEQDEMQFKEELLKMQMQQQMQIQQAAL